MVVRFDNNKLQATQAQKDNLIGVEGDPSSLPGGVSEADAIVSESKKFIAEGGDPLAPKQPTTQEMMADVERNQEGGPELNPAALEHARRDNKPPQMHDGPPTPAVENPATGAAMANAMNEHIEQMDQAKRNQEQNNGQGHGRDNQGQNMDRNNMNQGRDNDHNNRQQQR
jgi:protein phosphatase PTC1